MLFHNCKWQHHFLFSQPFSNLATYKQLRGGTNPHCVGRVVTGAAYTALREPAVLLLLHSQLQGAYPQAPQLDGAAIQIVLSCGRVVSQLSRRPLGLPSGIWRCAFKHYFHKCLTWLGEQGRGLRNRTLDKPFLLTLPAPVMLNITH